MFSRNTTSSNSTATSRPRAALGDITNNVPRADSNKTRKPSIFSSRSHLPSVGGGHQQENVVQNQPAAPPVAPILNAPKPPPQQPPFQAPPQAVPLPPQVEERSYMLREVDDIDIGEDAQPINLCSNYATQMYEYFYTNEKVFAINPTFLSAHRHINENMRGVLIDWIAEVHLKYKLSAETLYLTVNILDRYLERVTDVTTSKLQLIGVTALLLAAKIEEIYPPEVQELSYLTKRAYTVKEIVQTESDMASVLDYNFTVPTIYTFLCRYLKAAHADKIMVQVACYLAERSLQEYSMLQFPPSLVAAQCIRSARMMTNRYPWSPTLRKYTNVDEEDMTACGEAMKRYMEQDQALEAIGVKRNQKVVIVNKYSRSRNGSVAQLPLMF
jgi:G2/mitotic-specific cyclin-B, other